MAFPPVVGVAGITKSWTRTRWGDFAGRHVRPAFLKSPISSFFFVSTEIVGCCCRWARYMRGIAAFACITGWRTPSEILPLEWRHVDMQAGEVRLDAGTTKNGEGRVFPLTRDLRRVLDDQLTIAQHLTRERGIPTRFVFCYTVGE